MHWFIDPIKNHFADFTGRATRQQYWMFTLIYVILYVAVSIVQHLLHTQIFTMLLTLVILIPSVALTTRRLHDIGKSGWWQLIYFLPFLGLIVMLIFLIKGSQEGSNKYDTTAAGDGDATPMEAEPVLAEASASADEVPQSEDADMSTEEEFPKE